MNFDFFIQKADEDYYIKIITDKLKYSYDVGNMQFFADSIYIGKQESSKYYCFFFFIVNGITLNRKELT